MTAAVTVCHSCDAKHVASAATSFSNRLMCTSATLYSRKHPNILLTTLVENKALTPFVIPRFFLHLDPATLKLVHLQEFPSFAPPVVFTGAALQRPFGHFICPRILAFFGICPLPTAQTGSSRRTK